MIDAVEIFRKNWEECWVKATAARDKEIARLALKAKTLEIASASLHDCLMALLPPTVARAGKDMPVATDDMPNGGQPRAVKKRAAVTATREQLDTVCECLRSLGQGQPVTIKQLRGATKLGPKTLGAALRFLKTEGVACVLPGRRWVLQPQDGAGGA